MSQAILQHAIEFAWRHWTLLGVRGVAPPPGTAVDLEGLIAFTLHLAADEPRLVREAADWCARIGPRFISVARLRRLLRTFPQAPAHGPVDLFALVADRTVAAKFQGSGKSHAPDLSVAELVQLRARMLFGVGARADVLTRLAAHEWTKTVAAPLKMLHPPGYARQSVAIVLDELASAGLLQKVSDGHAVGYRLLSGEALRALLRPRPRRQVNWVARLFQIATILQVWRRVGTRATYGIELAKELDQLKRNAPSIAVWPGLIGSPVQVIAAVDRWAIALLDDEAWRAEWSLGGTDIGDAVLQQISDEVVQAVSEGDYPVGSIELRDYAFRGIDLAAGTARFHVNFSADHHREAFTFTGHVEGALSFAPAARSRDAVLASLEVVNADVHFDLGEDLDAA